MKRRVVVTGMGILAPNAHGLTDFEKALREGKSGIRFIEKMKDAGFACHVGGIPENYLEKAKEYFSEDRLLAMNELLIYAGITAIDAWKDAGLKIPEQSEDTVYWDTGTIIGIGQSDTDTIWEVAHKIDAGKVRRLGSTVVEKIMTSAPSARVTELLALGGQASTISSACTTGTDAVITSARMIQAGFANRMVAGGVDTASLLNWGGFDAMKVLNKNFNDTPEKASRPMSATAAGFIPGAGAGMLILEELETAKKRGARIYAELAGACLNGGGHRMGGSMTFPNPEGVRRAITDALTDAGITANEIDVVNGHLTGTIADPLEIGNWSKALGRGPENFPYINSTKSLVGHCLGAAGGVEGVTAVLQIYKGFVHGSLNCEDIHPDIAPFEKSVVKKTIDTEINYLAKSSFGFGDVNGVAIWKKYRE
ncbi:MAG: beta-ketoacyl-[acyl-carrier-protein] synthase family protein [Spirochaetia bacterium]|nr:beta-ketoacyl-[acyl-carrier-protein] synthase family protein [Spirochaetia bacterium]